MISEGTKCEILKVFGYTPDDLQCANADTAIGELFEQDHFSEPMTMLHLFIMNCSEKDFKELKNLIGN